MKRYKWIIWACAVVVVIITIAVIFTKKDSQQNIFIVKKDTLQKTVEGTGRLMPYSQVTVYAPLSGKIKEMCVKDGEEVVAGQVLYRIDTTELDSQLTEMKLKLEEYETKLLAELDTAARRKAELAIQLAQSSSMEYGSIKEAIEGYLKQQALNEAIAVSGSLENTVAETAEAKVMKSKIRSLENLIASANVTAPISGEVTLGTIEKGSAVAEATPTMVINNTDSLKVRVTLHESEYDDIKIGQKVYVKGGGEGVVSSRKNMLTKDSSGVMLGEFDVVLSKKPEGALLSKVNLTVVTAEIPECLVVPSLWVSKDSGGYYVYVQKKGRTVKTYITIGLDNGEYTQVKSGLEEGDKVVSPLADNKN